MLLGNGNTVAWLTPYAAVVREHGQAVNGCEQMDEAYYFSFNADGKDIVAVARSPEYLLEIRDIVVRLLAVSVAQSVRLSYDALINAPSLPYLMEQCQSFKRSIVVWSRSG
jgi:hypothetical protein